MMDILVVAGLTACLAFSFGNFLGYAKGYHEGLFRAWGIRDED